MGKGQVSMIWLHEFRKTRFSGQKTQVGWTPRGRANDVNYGLLGTWEDFVLPISGQTIGCRRNRFFGKFFPAAGAAGVEHAVKSPARVALVGNMPHAV
jgi:hypothetical protein